MNVLAPMFIFAVVLLLTAANDPHSDASLLSNKSTEYVQRIYEYSDEQLLMPGISDAVTGMVISDSFQFLANDAHSVLYSVHYVPNAYCQFDGHSGRLQVSDADGHSIRRFTLHLHELTHDHEVVNPLTAAFVAAHEVETIRGNVLYLHSGCHYWHIHHETIAQLHLYRQAGVFEAYRPGNLTILLRSGCVLSNPLAKDILAFFEADFARQGYATKVIHSGVIYQADLFIDAPHYSAPTAFSAKYVNDYVRARTPRLPHTPRRIYIDREEGYHRKIRNKPDLLAVLAKYNITLYSPLAHPSYASQREIFVSAELVISAEGTGFSMNACFCDPNKTIMIEMFGNPLHTYTGFMVAHQLGFQHYHALSPSYDQDKTTGDFNVNVTTVEALLGRLLG